MRLSPAGVAMANHRLFNALFGLAQSTIKFEIVLSQWCLRIVRARYRPSTFLAETIVASPPYKGWQAPRWR
jgi:hypothetical protein